MLGQPAECLLTVEHHMGGIAPIVPVIETGIVGLEASHDTQTPVKQIRKRETLFNTCLFDKNLFFTMIFAYICKIRGKWKHT